MAENIAIKSARRKVFFMKGYSLNIGSQMPVLAGYFEWFWLKGLAGAGVSTN